MTTAREPAGRVMLVGMMGAGKSTVGAILAQRLGWRYLDSDAQVQAATGRTVPEIFETSGETAFRAAEATALRDALCGAPQVVVSVAGGAVLDPGNRDLLQRSGTVVWLRARVETLCARVGDGRGRPLLAGDAAAALGRLEAERRPLYTGLADVVVDVDGLDPAAVVDQVLTDLAGLTGTSDTAGLTGTSGASGGSA